MISQSCPRCGSNRIRRGYHPTSILWRMVGRYNLLCNNCNWEFIGFAVPGTVKSNRGKKRKRKNEANIEQAIIPDKDTAKLGEGEIIVPVKEDPIAAANNELIAPTFEIKRAENQPIELENEQSEQVEELEESTHEQHRRKVKKRVRVNR